MPIIFAPSIFFWFTLGDQIVPSGTRTPFLLAPGTSRLATFNIVPSERPKPDNSQTKFSNPPRGKSDRLPRGQLRNAWACSGSRAVEAM
jgi:hypothetical protein